MLYKQGHRSKTLLTLDQTDERKREEMVYSSLQRRIALRRKLHILRTLTNSKSVKKSSIIMDSLLYIYKLKLKLEAMEREYSNLMAIKKEYLNLMKYIQVPKEVKVEKIGEKYLIRVICKKGGNSLVSILEAFDEMGLNVLQASVSCIYFFAMEAIAVAQNQQQALDVRDVTQVILKAIDKGNEQETNYKSLEVPSVNE